MNDWDRLEKAKHELTSGSEESAEELLADILTNCRDDMLLTEATYSVSDNPALARKMWSLLDRHAVAPDQDLSEAAMRGLIVADSEKALTLLEGLLNHENSAIRWNAVFVLTGYGRTAERVLPKLCELLTEDPAPNVRWNAALAISALSADPSEASAFLAPALEDTQFDVRVYAAAHYVKGQPRDPAAAKILTEGLQSDDLYVQDQAITGIGLLRGKAQASQAIQLLSELVPAAGPELGNSIIESIASLGRESPDSVLKLLESDSSIIVASAASAIEAWSQRAAEYVSNLLGALNRVLALPPLTSRIPDPDGRDYCRNSLLITLGKVVGIDDQEVRPYLLDAYTNDNELVRAAIAQGIGSIGLRDDRAIQTLEALLSDEDETVRQNASASLAKLQG